ncbi:hypothetical protein EJ06DRAFT_253356 [Trichodelitschia bisporula]|uniref:Uncharacterized protein n=1 Tax=Trichodelitschia bisporula TaxID=703511 RepID=A0A6G1HJG1_9PEZI|nr:hypothetical protein EJ06DRAFT_253356 [Trichodelitschia bisporula]
MYPNQSADSRRASSLKPPMPPPSPQPLHLRSWYQAGDGVSNTFITRLMTLNEVVDDNHEAPNWVPSNPPGDAPLFNEATEIPLPLSRYGSSYAYTSSGGHISSYRISSSCSAPSQPDFWNNYSALKNSDPSNPALGEPFAGPTEEGMIRGMGALERGFNQTFAELFFSSDRPLGYSCVTLALQGLGALHELDERDNLDSLGELEDRVGKEPAVNRVRLAAQTANPESPGQDDPMTEQRKLAKADAESILVIMPSKRLRAMRTSEALKHI